MILVYFLYVALSIIIGMMAKTQRGRNPIRWFFIALITTPMFAFFILKWSSNLRG